MLGGGVERSLTRASQGDLRLVAGHGHRGACDQYSLVPSWSPALGDARRGAGKLGRKSLPACRIPRLSLTSSFVATAGHPKNTSTHILLWLLITANFVKLEPLGTKSTPFPFPSLARPLFQEQDRRGFSAFEPGPSGDSFRKYGPRLAGTLAPRGPPCCWSPRKALRVAAARLGRALADSPATAQARPS